MMNNSTSKRATAKNSDKMNLMEHLHHHKQEGYLRVADEKTVTVIWYINDTSQDSQQKTH